MMIIKARDLFRVYRTRRIETVALQGVDLYVQSGEFVVIRGPSGCGKSTLLNMIGLLDEPSSGLLEVLGKDVSSFKERERTMLRRGGIGFIFQGFNLIDELTVFENVEIPLVYMRVPADERKLRVEAVLDLVNISHRKDHYPGQMSGGQQQRAAIARALVGNPKLVLADEPTGNLDSKNGEQVLALLHQLSEMGTTILMVTHDTSDLAERCRCIQMFDGAILGDEENGKTPKASA